MSTKRAASSSIEGARAVTTSFFLLLLFIMLLFFFSFFDGWHMAVRRLPRRRKLIREFPTNSRLSIVLSLGVARAQAPGKFTINAIGPHVSTGEALEHLGPTIKKSRPTRSATTDVVTSGFLQNVVHDAQLTDVLVRWIHFDPLIGAVPAGVAEELWRAFFSATAKFVPRRKFGAIITRAGQLGRRLGIVRRVLAITPHDGNGQRQ